MGPAAPIRLCFDAVGDGPLQAATTGCVCLNRLLARSLFVGRSNDVQFWFGNIGKLLVLWRVDGLPDAAIEQQIGGIKVTAVSTSGTVEPIPEARSLLLSCADPIEVDEAAQRLALIGRYDWRTEMDPVARGSAFQTFSGDRPYERILQVMCS